MTAAPFFLIAVAIADWLISLRPLKAIANHLEIAPEELQKDLPKLTQSHTFRGQLEAALAEPNIRPDLIPQKIHLARLEEQLTILLKQRDRAEDRIERILSRPDGRSGEGADDSELFKAEIFANRVQQQCTKLINNIEKERKNLQKAAAEPAQTRTPVAPHSTAPVSTQRNIASTPAALDIGEQAPPQQATCNPITAGAARIPLTPTPTDEEFLNCLVSNRQRLKDTPAKDRQKLIARLIEEHRQKNTVRAA